MNYIREAAQHIDNNTRIAIDPDGVHVLIRDDVGRTISKIIPWLIIEACRVNPIIAEIEMTRREFERRPANDRTRI